MCAGTPRDRHAGDRRASGHRPRPRRRAGCAPGDRNGAARPRRAGRRTVTRHLPAHHSARLRSGYRSRRGGGERRAGQHRPACRRKRTQRLQRGFRVLKLKVGVASIDHEIEHLRRLAALLPPAIQLRLDANRAWSSTAAERFLRHCAELPIEMLEEPLAEPSLERLLSLQAQTKIAIAIDESAELLDAEHLLGRPAVRRLVIKPTRCGGLLPAAAGHRRRRIGQDQHAGAPRRAAARPRRRPRAHPAADLLAPRRERDEPPRRAPAAARAGSGAPPRRCSTGRAPSTASARACCASTPGAHRPRPGFTIHDREDSADLMNLVRHELGFAARASAFPLKGTCLAIYSARGQHPGAAGEVLQASFPWCAEWEAS
jgi:hypothetical protein